MNLQFSVEICSDSNSLTLKNLRALFSGLSIVGSDSVQHSSTVALIDGASLNKDSLFESFVTAAERLKPYVSTRSYTK